MVKLYTQNGCGMCRTIHMLLEQKHIDFEEVLVNDAKDLEGTKVTCTPTLVTEDGIFAKKEIIDWVRSR